MIRGFRGSAFHGAASAITPLSGFAFPKAGQGRDWLHRVIASAHKRDKSFHRAAFLLRYRP
jgi:hypothetical protein